MSSDTRLALNSAKASSGVSPQDRWRAFTAASLPYLLILPAVALVLGITVYPTLQVLGSSLTNWSLDRTRIDFIGLKNYVWLALDPQFWLTLRNTAIFSVGVLLLVLTLGFLLALALNEEIKFRAFFRTSVVLPWAITATVTGVMWRWMLMPDIGLVTYVVELFGAHVPFLLDSRVALAMLVVVEVWRSTGYGMILLLAGLQGINPTLHEAAKLDGATYVQYVRRIVIPLLVPTILIVTILMSIRTVNLIDLVLVLTGGGPARQTETLGLFMWKESFQLYGVGYGSAIAVIMFAINIVMTFCYIKVLVAD
jgi:multiple sugar transport system permease protein